MKTTAGDCLAEYYSKKAQDSKQDEKFRKASELFAKAEGHLEDAVTDKAIKVGNEALVLFREIGDAKGVTDALRLVIMSMITKADWTRADTEGGPNSISSDFLHDAEEIAREELAVVAETGNLRSEAGMLLAIAEINHQKRGHKKREEALLAVQDAIELYEDAEDRVMEAKAWLTLSRLQYKRQDAQDSVRASKKAIELYKRLGDRLGEAKAMMQMAYSYDLGEAFQDQMQVSQEAVELLREVDAPGLAAQLLQNMAIWCIRRGKAKEAVAWVHEAMDVAESLRTGRTQCRATLLHSLVQALIDKGDSLQAVEEANEYLDEFKAEGLLKEQVFAYDALALAHMSRGECEEAAEAAKEGIETTKQINNKGLQIQLLHTLAQVEASRKDYDMATAALQEGKEIAQRTCDKSQEILLLHNLVEIHNMKKEFGDARTVAAEELSVSKEGGDAPAAKKNQAFALMSQADIAGYNQDFAEAQRLAVDAQYIYADIGDKYGEAKAELGLAQAQLALGSASAASSSAKSAYAVFQALGDPKMQIDSLNLLARIYVNMNWPEEAVKHLTQARRVTQEIDDKMTDVRLAVFLARTYLAVVAKDIEKRDDNLSPSMNKALKPAREAVAVAKKVATKDMLCSAHIALGEASKVAGRMKDALSNALEAEELAVAIEHGSMEAQAVVLSAEAYRFLNDTSNAKKAAKRALELAAEEEDDTVKERANRVLAAVDKAGPAQVVQGPADDDDEEGGEQTTTDVQEVAKKEGLTPDAVQKMLKDITAQMLDEDNQIHWDAPLMDSGLDSLTSVSYRNELTKQTGLEFSAALIFDYPTQAALTDHIVEMSQME